MFWEPCGPQRGGLPDNQLAHFFLPRCEPKTYQTRSQSPSLALTQTIRASSWVCPFWVYALLQEGRQREYHAYTNGTRIVWILHFLLFTVTTVATDWTEVGCGSLGRKQGMDVCKGTTILSQPNTKSLKFPSFGGTQRYYVLSFFPLNWWQQTVLHHTPVHWLQQTDMKCQQGPSAPLLLGLVPSRSRDVSCKGYLPAEGERTTIYDIFLILNNFFCQIWGRWQAEIILSHDKHVILSDLPMKLFGEKCQLFVQYSTEVPQLQCQVWVYCLSH
jgi:hypothetical protein